MTRQSMQQNELNDAAVPADAPKQHADDLYGRLAQEMPGSPRQNFDQMLAVFKDDKKDSKEEKEVTLKTGEYDKIGPLAKKVLEDNDVEEIKITPRPGQPDLLEATLKKSIEIKQDPKADGCNKLILDKNISAELEKGPNGEYILKNIKGLTAETDFGTATVNRIELSREANGDTHIKSQSRFGILRPVRERTKPAEVLDKADQLFKKLDDLKKGTGAKVDKTKMSALEFDSIFSA